MRRGRTDWTLLVPAIVVALVFFRRHPGTPIMALTLAAMLMSIAFTWGSVGKFIVPVHPITVAIVAAMAVVNRRFGRLPPPPPLTPPPPLPSPPPPPPFPVVLTRRLAQVRAEVGRGNCEVWSTRSPLPSSSLRKSRGLVTAEQSLGTRLLLLASVVIWGSTFVAMRIALAQVTPLELVGLRFGIGLPVLAVVLRAKRIPLGFDRRTSRRSRRARRSSSSTSSSSRSRSRSRGSTATNTGWIISFSPLGIALLSWLFLGERLSAGQLGGIALATFGVLLLVSKGDVENLAWLESRGDWLIFGTAFTWALYTIVTRDLSRRRSPLAVTFIVFLPLCLVALGTTAARSDLPHFLHLSPSVVASIVFLGVLGRSPNGSGSSASAGSAPHAPASTSISSPWRRRLWPCRCSARRWGSRPQWGQRCSSSASGRRSGAPRAPIPEPVAGSTDSAPVGFPGASHHRAVTVARIG